MNPLVTAARKYLGAPFRHRGRGPKYFDCVGVGLQAFRDCGVTLPDFRLYGSEPHQDGLLTHLRAALGEEVLAAPVRMADLAVGDVVVLRFDVEPHHVGLLGDYRFGGLSLIHADGHTGRVVEHRLADKRVAHITHVFRRSV